MVITGQKIWTSLAHLADWCFVLARTERPSRAQRPVLPAGPDEPAGRHVRPIVQLTGTSEFNEVFFDKARTAAAQVVGAPGEGWRIAMATLAFERGVSTLGQQVGFGGNSTDLVQLARRTGAADDPLIRDRIARAWIGLRVIRAYAIDTRTGPTTVPGLGPKAAVVPLAPRPRRTGHDGARPAGVAAGTTDRRWQRLFLFSRADTIYGGSDEIQHNIIAERALGLPRDP